VSEDKPLPIWISGEEDGGAASESGVEAPLLTGSVDAQQVRDSSALGIESYTPPPKERSKSAEFALGLFAAPIVIWVAALIIGETFGWLLGAPEEVSLWTAGLGFVGATVAGFTTGHHSFSWGLLASIIVIPMLIFALLFGFCMLMVMSGEGFY
jgi:hypothetical protein|tara:strand:+ start:315 stop:776 length:462 start_codon:yes stop_codon:yes gene_type:complete